MLKVGITGGIGSGKTTVCAIFATLGVPIYYADDRAKELMVSDEHLIQSIQGLLGEQAYNADNTLNRPFIAQQVFKDKNLLQKLNAIVHPAVFKDKQIWYETHHSKKYTLYETAILFESGSYKMLDKIITVFAPREERIARTMKRDNLSREEVLSRMDKQIAEEEKMAKSDFIIYNDHSQPLIHQVLTIHQQLISL
ncbi:MAG: dephospho-CoA kinase [Chitinophagales bacterium]